MKTIKILFATLVIVLSTSCKKEVYNCSCGVVVAKNKYEYPTSTLHTVSVRNSCSDNIEELNISRVSSIINSGIQYDEIDEHWSTINIGDNECVYIWNPDGTKQEYNW
jgi:hypothetical protein